MKNLCQNADGKGTLKTFILTAATLCIIHTCDIYEDTIRPQHA